ncbi:MAG: PA14 domain-containing protein [Chryseolinea sp.]
MDRSLREISISVGGFFDGLASRSILNKWMISVGCLLAAGVLSFEGHAQTTSQTFNSSTTFSVPAGVTSITVEAWGAGGAGGGNHTANSNFSGGGGGGGGYSTTTISVSSSDLPYQVNIGDGGNGVTNGKGGDGGASTFRTNSGTILLTAGGGVGGNQATAGAVGAGGAAGTGSTFNGGAGGNGANNAAGRGGGGGGSSAGSNAVGRAGGVATTTTGAAGGSVTTPSVLTGAGAGAAGGNSGAAGGSAAANTPGGGGGGAGNRTGGNNRAGGDGADGRIVITYYVPQTYYSRANNVSWNVNSSWSTISHASATNSGTYPIAGDIAIIGTGHQINTNGSQACDILTINGSGILNFSAAQTVTLSGNLTMDGTSQVTGTGNDRILNIGGTFTVAGTATNARIGGLQVNFNGAGPHSVGGALTFNSDTGVKTFAGSVANSGTWSSIGITTTGNLVFRNGISNSGTFSAGIATFNTNSQALSGSSAMSFANTVTIATGITLTDNNTNTVTMNALSFAASANSSVSMGTGATLAVTNAITFTDPATASTAQTLAVNAGTVTAGSITLADCTNNGTRTNNVTVNSGGTLTVNGNITTNGSNANENFVTLNGTGVLNIAGTFTGGTFAVSNTGAPSTMSTVRWFGDNTNFRNLTYGNLIIEIPASATNSRNKAPGANMTVQGDFTAESLHATNTVTMDPAGNDFTVGGDTYLNARGRFADATNGGTNTFQGDVNIASNGTLSLAANSAAVFQSDITNDGTASVTTTGLVSFTGSGDKTVSGSGTFTFTLASLTLNTTGAANVYYNGSGNVTISTTLNFAANGLLIVGANANIVMGSGANISNNSGTRYVQLDGTSGANSQLMRTSTTSVNTLRFLFPVGTATGGYTPVDLATSNAVTGTGPDNGSTLAVKPIYSSSITGQLKRTFRLTTANNDNTTTLTNARFYYNSSTDVAGTDNINTFTTISFLDSNVGTWATVTGTAPNTASGYFIAPGTAQNLSNGTYYYTIGGTTPSCTAGNQTDYGTNSWIGYVYDGANNFTTNYLGRITEGQNFDESFGGDYANFPLGAGCSVYTETFSVRFKMALTVTTCGVYPITIGGDDGVRLSVDGGANWEFYDLYNDHAYTEATQNIYLDAGVNNLVLEYYENATNNRVRFNMGSMNGTLVTGGRIGSDQTLCQTSIDPALLTSIFAGRDCSGNTPTYQWQYSSVADFSSAVTDISPNGTSATYDPTTQPAGTRYYRRRAIVGGITVYSNIITILAESPAGNQTTAGANTWIGYVYDGAQNFSTNYMGYLTAAQQFDYSFCGDNCVELLTGCRITTETFTVRYRMSFVPSTTAGYTFTIGADDGVRLSVDGGSTYVVSDWGDHGYQETSSSVINMTAGNTYNLVLDYYENGGGNRVKFAYTTGPLPVTWSFLDGYHSEGNNVVEWRTASEKNNSGFEVQRSLNGTAFESIGFVPGNGTTVVPQSYKFIDNSPGIGWNYYRLKQIDFDNAFDYSKVIPVYSESERKPGIYPNPASSSLFISHGGSHLVSDAYLLSAQTGVKIPLTRDEKQPSRYPLDGIPSGSYVVMFTLDGIRYTEKVIVIK